MSKNFIGRDGKTYTYAMVLGRMCLCVAMPPEKPKTKKVKASTSTPTV